MSFDAYNSCCFSISGLEHIMFIFRRRAAPTLNLFNVCVICCSYVYERNVWTLKDVVYCKLICFLGSFSQQYNPMVYEQRWIS